MPKIAIVVLADTETHGDLGRATNALQVAREFKQAGDPVQIVFDGAGTKWVAALSDPDHRQHRLWKEVRDNVAGACQYCARAFGVRDDVENAGVALLDDHAGHPSLRAYVLRDYQVLTF